MKIFLFTIFSFLVFGIQAQDKKPTKEATIKFMATVLKSIEGKKYLSSGMYHEIIEVNFDGNTYSSLSSWNNGPAEKETSTNIKWESYDEKNSDDEKEADNLVKFLPWFSLKIKCEFDRKISFRNNLILSIPKEKLSSFKKACLRLAEIAKEENKDPFE